MGLILYSPDDQITAPTSDGFNITESPQPPIVTVSLDLVSHYDATITNTETVTAVNPLIVTATDGDGSPCEVVSTSPEDVTVDEAGLAVPLRRSEALLEVHSPNLSKYGSKAVFRQWNTTHTSVDGAPVFKSGSLAAYLVATFDAMIFGLTPGTSTYNTYSSNPYNGGAVTRNPNLFCKDYDLSGMAVATQEHSGTSYNPPCLISPRHAITCTHWLGAGGGANTLVYFRGVLGTIYTRTRTGNLLIGSAASDISLMALDSDLPIYSPSSPLVDGVILFQLLPGNAANWLAELGGYRASNTPDGGAPLFEYPLLTKFANYGDRFGIQWVSNFPNYYQYTGPSGDYFMYRYGVPVQRYRAWCPGPIPGRVTAVYPGDSGSPDFLPINGKLVLLGTHNLTIGASLINRYLSEIQAGMDSLVSGYSPTIVDLSAFNQYTSQ